MHDELFCLSDSKLFLHTSCKKFSHQIQCCFVVGLDIAAGLKVSCSKHFLSPYCIESCFVRTGFKIIFLTCLSHPSSQESLYIVSSESELFVLTANRSYCSNMIGPHTNKLRFFCFKLIPWLN